MNRATIAASTAASLVAAACGGGAAQVAEPSPGVVPEPAHSPAMAPPVTEAVPEATTPDRTVTTATSQPPGQARIEVAAVESPEPVELDDDEWWRSQPGYDGTLPHGACGDDLPPCWVMWAESGGDPTVWNTAGSGASGKWQFMPGTWAGYGGYSAAAYAPESVQDERARQVWAGGAGCSHWAAC